MSPLLSAWMLLTLSSATAGDPGYGVRCADVHCASCERAPIRSVRHNSALTPTERYGAQMAFDQNKATAWCEGEPGTGVGRGMIIILQEPRVIEAIRIHGGYFKSADLLKANGRARAIEMTASHGQSGQSFSTMLRMTDPVEVPAVDPCTHQPPDLKAAWFEIARDGNGAHVFANDNKSPTRMPVDAIELTLTEVFPGSRYQDTCISEIEIIVRER